ncbi:hypothetical protein EON66_11030, partial [archaeon]
MKQITEHRLPRDFDYHRIPAPWIQLKLLRILAVLGQSDRVASEQMYEVLLEVMRRADTGTLRPPAAARACDAERLQRRTVPRAHAHTRVGFFFGAGINVGFAIVYECVRTVTTIYPNTTLLDAAAH